MTTTVTIDGQDVPIRIAAFDFESKNEFVRDYQRFNWSWQRTKALTRFALSKASLPAELELADLEGAPADESDEARAEREANNHAILQENAARQRAHEEHVALALALRDLDETPAQRERREALNAADDAFASAFISRTFERFISVDPSFELIDAADRPVRTGLDLLRSYPSFQLYSIVLVKLLTQNSQAANLRAKLAEVSR